MSGGGKITSTKLSFTLPISCQICLEKVKEPVTCPNQHVFCCLCMEVWLERNKQCPTCRVDITPQSPVRKIIGGLPQAQSEEIRSPRTSKHMRRARMELLFRDYEHEISELQREVACLKLSNDDLKTRLREEEQKNIPGHAVTKSKCSRCGNMQDLDSMLEMAKNLQDATRTFEQMKNENVQLKLSNERMIKESDDLKRHNTSVKEELLMRSPMKFGRLTVATLESRLDSYEKKISQLNKALEKSDSFTESLQEKLKNCNCNSDAKLGETIVLKSSGKEQQSVPMNQNYLYLSEHDYTCINLSPDEESLSLSHTQATDVGDGVTTFAIENILQNDLVSQSLVSATINENSVDSSLLISQSGNLTSPFTPSTKFSKLSLATPTTNPTRSCLSLNLNDNVPFQNYTTACSVSTQEFEHQPLPTIKELDAKVRSFTAHTMPPVESPDYKEKLEQIQGNLLHPITSSSGQMPGQIRSFSRRLTFEETLQAAKNSETFDLKFLEENTSSSCGDEVMMMLQSEDSIQSIDPGQDLGRSHDELRFIRPQSILKCDGTATFLHELNEGSSNPVLSSGQYQTEESQTQNITPKLQREVSSSIVEAGSSRITTTKLSQGDRDVFTRPSSAPSRTFLLSGSRFSALRPLDTTGEIEASQFQPVKCKSPSPLSMRRLQPSPQNRSFITPKKEGIRCVVDGRAASPLLRLVSPDEVISTNWKQTTCHARSSSSDAQANYKSKDSLSRIAILKRNNSGTTLSAYQSNIDAAKSPFHAIYAQQQTDDNTTSTSRRSSRKQCLNDPNSKRVGEHSLEFVSPVKSPKIETRWNWS